MYMVKHKISHCCSEIYLEIWRHWANIFFTKNYLEEVDKQIKRYKLFSEPLEKFGARGQLNRPPKYAPVFTYAVPGSSKNSALGKIKFGGF